MANGKISKIQIESANGTVTDITSFVGGLDMYAEIDNPNRYCQKCYYEYNRPLFIKNPIKWLFYKWHKCKPLILSGLENTSITFNGIWEEPETKPYEPDGYWKWN